MYILFSSSGGVRGGWGGASRCAGVGLFLASGVFPMGVLKARLRAAALLVYTIVPRMGGTAADRVTKGRPGTVEVGGGGEGGDVTPAVTANASACPSVSARAAAVAVRASQERAHPRTRRVGGTGLCCGWQLFFFSRGAPRTRRCGPGQRENRGGGLGRAAAVAGQTHKGGGESAPRAERGQRGRQRRRRPGSKRKRVWTASGRAGGRA